MQFDRHSDGGWRAAGSGDRRDAPTGNGARRPASAPARPLTSERAAEIRDRVLAGVYNGHSMAEEVARRILASGDLTP